MDFQRRLLDVGNSLSSDEVKAMAFLCSEPLDGKAGAAAATAPTAFDLFSRLHEQGRLSEGWPHLLLELLRVIQRAPLAQLLAPPEVDSVVATPERGFICPYRKLLYSLSEDLTESNLHEMKFLLNGLVPRRKLERSTTTLEVFVEMERMGLISSTDLHNLKKIIQKICPMLMAKITQFETKCIPEILRIAEKEPLASSQSKPFTPDPMPEEKPVSTNAADVPNVNRVDECEALMSTLSTEASGLSPPQGTVATPGGNELPRDERALASLRGAISDAEAYPMARRGVCLIINNYKFTKSPKYFMDREGTMADLEALRQVFQWLGFRVEVENDCPGQRMLSVLRGLSRRDHRRADGLVCCVLSHGTEGGVYGVDGTAVALEQLTGLLDGQRCPSLAGKPKLFFVQACQGALEQSAVPVECDGPGPVQSDAVRVPNSVPAGADFLLAMATVNSFACYRDKVEGTWFIQSLCRNLVQSVPRGVDLMSILTNVNADVGQKTHSNGSKQMPQPAFTLRKRVVFPIPNEPPPKL